MWLTGNKIVQSVLNGDIKIEPFHFENVNPNSYNYTIFPVIKRIKNEILDLKQEDEFEEIFIDESGYVLLPGECYLGCTNEIFRSDIFASLVTGRSSIGRKFITNHITAGLIDQGFEGRITLEITVVKPTRIYPNVPFGQIHWFETSGEPFLYDGKYQKQNTPEISKVNKDFVNKIKQKKLFIVPEMNPDSLNFEDSFYYKENKEEEYKSLDLEAFRKTMKDVQLKESIDRIEITGGRDPLLYENINELIIEIKHYHKKIKIYTKGTSLTEIPFVDEINIVLPVLDYNFEETKNVLLFYRKFCNKLRLCVPMVLGFSSSQEEQEKLFNSLIAYCDEFVFRPLSSKFKDKSFVSSFHGVLRRDKVKYDVMEFDNPRNTPLMLNYQGELLNEIK